MPWFYVDDGFSDSKPVMNLPDRYRLAACGLWVLGGSWSAKEETDGFVPDSRMRQLLAGQHRRGPIVRALTDSSAALCEEVDGGFLLKNWNDWQQSHAELVEKRRKNASKVQKWREDNRLPPAPKKHGRGAKASRNLTVLPVTESVTDQSSNQVRTRHPTRPDPTRRDISSYEENAPYVSNAPARDDSFAPPDEGGYQLATTNRADALLSPPVTLGASRLVGIAMGPNTVDDAARTILRIKTSEGLAQGRTEAEMGECLRVWLTKPQLGPHALLACLTEVDKTRMNGHRVATSDRNFAETQSLKARFVNSTTPPPKELDT